MEDQLQLSVVLPVYNEGEAAAPVIRALVEAIRVPCEILVVYDFDGDTTVPVARALASEFPAVKPLRNDLGRGVLNAMKAGIAAARAPYVVVSMADGSDEPQVVNRMVELARDGADVVAASRYMKGGHQIGGPVLKRLMSRAAGLSLHWFAGVPIHDPTSNFKLYSRRFLDSVTIESTAGFEFALELSVKATLDHRRLAEVPTTWRDRTSGKSNFKMRQWLPNYLHWYFAAIRGRFSPSRRSKYRSRGRHQQSCDDDRAVPSMPQSQRAAGTLGGPRRDDCQELRRGGGRHRSGVRRRGRRT